MTESGRESTRARGRASIAVAMGIMNIATYGYTVAAAHLIGPEAFGAFSALMGVLLVVNVLSLGLQATGARRIAADPHDVHEIERVVLRAGYRSAAALALLCVLLAPALNSLLRLDSLPTALLVALAVAPLTVMGAQAGILQGERRWAPLAYVYLAQGLGRVACGLGLMIVWRSEFAAVLGVALGAWIPVVVGALALRQPRASAPVDRESGTALMREVVGSSQALLAFFALSNADILMARAVLDTGQAGLYAGGLILVKAILFLPQFVVVIAFPSMSSRDARRTTLLKALAVSLGLGLCGMAGTLLFPDVALVFVGGSDFDEIRDTLWLFAIIGTLLSTIQLLVYSALARQSWRTIMMIWTTLVVLLALTPQVQSVTSLVLLVCTLDAALLVLLVLSALLARPRPVAEPVPPAERVDLA